MRIGRTLPPAASPIYPSDIISGLKGLFRGQKELERFKTELKDYFGMKYCFLASSGKASLTLILQALKDQHPDRDEVIIPAFTCFSVPSAIVRAGLKVRLCDIDPDTLDFNFHQLSQMVSECSSSKNAGPASSIQHPTSSRLLAIIPTHLFGLPADVDQLLKIIDDPEVLIIEDAAQAMGGEREGRKLGAQGEVSFLSLGRGKAFSTVEGGIILTNRKDMAERIHSRLARIPGYGFLDLLKLLSNTISLTVFQHPSLFWLPKSIPCLRLGETVYDPRFKMRKMSPFQAGLASTWKSKLGKFKRIRVINSRQWLRIPQTAHLKNPILYALSSNQKNPIDPTSLDNLWPPSLTRYPIRVEDESARERILGESERKGLGVMPGYPDSINGIQKLKGHFRSQSFPNAKDQSKKLITLPIHPFVSQNDNRNILALISQSPPYES